MRIRQGFVSNSSSSSFIIVVDPIELNTERIIEEKFNGNKTVSSYGHDIDVPRLVDLLISNVKSGINESESIEGNEEEVIAELKTSIGSWDKWDEIYGALFNSPKKDKSYRAKCDRKWKKYDNELKEKAEKMLDKMKSDNPDKKIVVVSFSDGDGAYYSYLEHHGVVEDIWPDTIKIDHH